jgi:hypothetical protein
MILPNTYGDNTNNGVEARLITAFFYSWSAALLTPKYT